MGRKGKAGFTLLELILVLAVISMIASLGVPSVTRLYDRSRFKSGVSGLQTDLAGTRLAAMQSGEILLFRCRLRAGQYEIVSGSTTRGGQLPDDMVFLGGAIGTPSGFRSIGAETDRRLDVSRDVRVNVIGSLKTPPSDDSGEAKVSPYETPGRGIADGWSRPILFYPNGHTSSAVLFLASSSEPEPAYFAEVSLRGITGMVRAGAVSANPPGSGGFESVLSGEAFAQLRRDENPERDPMRRYGVIQGGEL